MDSHRDELENKCASLDFLQSTADMCFSNLTEWANYTIFNKHQGELTYDLILDERVNARVISYVHHPYKVKIEVTYGMLRAIYKECLAYPAYCKKLEEDGWEFNAFDDEFEGAQLLFSGGVPSRIVKSDFVDAFLSLMEKEKDSTEGSYFSEDDYICRFTMYECMLSWVFFHELSHHVQGHYKFKKNNASGIHKEFLEVGDENDSNEIDSQLREILADMEGLYLTFRMMLKNNVFMPSNVYCLLYAQSSLFNLFYYNNPLVYDSLTNHNISHPHPKVRNKYLHLLFITIMSWDLQNPEYFSLREDFLRGFDYYTVKSSFLAGMIWSIRHQDNYDPNIIPDFLSFDRPDDIDFSSDYYKQLVISAITHIEEIERQHLIDGEQDCLFKVIDVKGFFGFLSL